jgi:hypothetical protein
MDFALWLFSFVGVYEEEKVFDITHHGIAGISESSIDHTREIFREQEDCTAADREEGTGKRQTTEEGIRKIRDISPCRMEDTKEKGGLQKVVKMRKRGEKGDVFYDEKLHNV